VIQNITLYYQYPYVPHLSSDFDLSDVYLIAYVLLCTGETQSNLKFDKDREIESCQEYKYLEVMFDTSITDDKEIRSRVTQVRECVACLNGMLWSKDIRKYRKLNIYNALI
jgi:hypothetical protein